MDTLSYADGEWLEANVNVQNGDHIRFEDEGENDEVGGWIRWRGDRDCDLGWRPRSCRRQIVCTTSERCA